MRSSLLLVVLALLPLPAHAEVVAVPVTLPAQIRVTISGAGTFNGVYVCRQNTSLGPGWYIGPAVNGGSVIMQFGAYRQSRTSTTVYTYMRVGIATHVYGLHWSNSAPGEPAWDVQCLPESGTPGAVRVQSL